MSLSYRSRRRIKRTLTALGVLALIALVVWLIWLIWVGRYIVYTSEGAKLDFSIDLTFPSGAPATAPPPAETVDIRFELLPTEETTPVTDLHDRLRGFYINVGDLKEDPTALISRRGGLAPGTAVLLDVKDHTGCFFSSDHSGTAASVDTDAMDSLIAWLAESDLYTIARLPALRDRTYALSHTEDGLAKDDGTGHLWADDDGHFWLDPTSEGTVDHLTEVVQELHDLGFREVVFTRFSFPETDELAFDGDRIEAITSAAAALCDRFAGEDLWISFEAEADFPLPTGNARLCLRDVPASQIHQILELTTATDPAKQLLFLTDSPDTRYDQYGVLRSLSQ